MKRYEVVRFVFQGENRVIKSGLTLEEVQEHCNDPETSSSTASEETLAEESATQWFDGYREE